MSTVVVSWTVKDEVIDASVVAGGYKVSVTGQPDQTVTDSPATFTGVGAGDYTATVVRVDANGADIGSAQSATFNIPVTTQTVSVPDVVNVTVS